MKPLVLIAVALAATPLGPAAFAEPIHLTCKSQAEVPVGGLLINLDYAAGTAQIATLSDLKLQPDRHGNTDYPIKVSDTQVTWNRDVNAGQVQKVFYGLSRTDGVLTVTPAEANGNVIMDAPVPRPKSPQPSSEGDPDEQGSLVHLMPAGRRSPVCGEARVCRPQA